MQTTNEIKEKKISNLLIEVNGFFAFGQSQFDEAKKEGVKYVSRGAGLYHEAGKSKYFDEQFNAIVKEYHQKTLLEKGKIKVILDELQNYECFYTGDIDEAVQVLKAYDITEKEVLKVYQDNININD
jgi:hypothetical protein